MWRKLRATYISSWLNANIRIKIKITLKIRIFFCVLLRHLKLSKTCRLFYLATIDIDITITWGEVPIERFWSRDERYQTQSATLESWQIRESFSDY